VASTAGAIPEVVGDAAMLVEPRDVPALSEALVELTRNEATRARLIAAGAERVRAFSWQQAGRDFAALYHSLAGAHRG
jgi:MMP alpha-(1->4)-mannosyltransferase